MHYTKYSLHFIACIQIIDFNLKAIRSEPHVLNIVTDYFGLLQCTSRCHWLKPLEFHSIANEQRNVCFKWMEFNLFVAIDIHAQHKILFYILYFTFIRFLLSFFTAVITMTDIRSMERGKSWLTPSSPIQDAAATFISMKKKFGWRRTTMTTKKVDLLLYYTVIIF